MYDVKADLEELLEGFKWEGGSGLAPGGSECD